MESQLLFGGVVVFIVLFSVLGYRFITKLASDFGTISVYLTLLITFLLLATGLHGAIYFVSYLPKEKLDIAVSSLTFLEDLIKMTVGALISALIPLTRGSKEESP